jgi:hypothetical protein
MMWNVEQFYKNETKMKWETSQIFMSQIYIQEVFHLYTLSLSQIVMIRSIVSFYTDIALWAIKNIVSYSIV